MNLLNPALFALGLGGIALPFVVHWLTRPRPTTVPLSTVKFLREIVQQRKARYRLRDFLVLLLRAAAVVLLAWAFGRPILHNRPAINTTDPSHVVRIVILDSSLSMKAKANGIEVFQRARSAASGYLNAQADARLNLILAAANAEPVFDRPSTNTAALREAIDRAKPKPEAINTQAAINRASELFAKSSDASLGRELVIVSDFQRSNWSAVDFSSLPKETKILLESVAPESTPPNFAISDVAIRGRAEAGREVTLNVDVANFSPNLRAMKIKVTLGDTAFTLAGDCPAGKRTTLSTRVPLPAAGWYHGEARLVDADDALSDDNERPFVLNVRPAPVYALITREPPQPRPTSSHFVERALVSAPNAAASDGAQRVLRMKPQDVDLAAVANASVFVIDRPGQMPEPALKLIASLARRGRSVVYIASEAVDAINLRTLAEAVGSDLRLPVDFFPPDTGAFRRNLSLDQVRRTEQPFAVFGDDLNANLQPLRFGGGLSTKQRAGGLADDILASYNDGSAALVLTSCGAGSVAVLNADLEQSNLIASRAFVPLLGELIGRQLARIAPSHTITCGEPTVAYLPAESGAAAGITITPPSPDVDPGTLADENNSVVWHTKSAGGPGIYSMQRNGKSLFETAAVSPAIEGDLETTSPEVFTTRLAGGRTIHVEHASDSDNARDDEWTYILQACALVLLIELSVLLWFKN